MAEDSKYLLEPLREGADFTFYRGMERGSSDEDPGGGGRC